MERDEFDHNFASSFQALKKRRGACPEGRILLSYAEGSLEKEKAEAVARHISLCGLCQDAVERLGQEYPEIDERTWRRIEKKLDRRDVPWKPKALSRRSFWFRMPAAAAAVAVAGVALWVSFDREPQTGPVSTTRGELVQVLEPVDRIGKLDLFRWNALPAASSFRLQVQQGQNIIWEAVVTGASYPPPEDLRRILLPETGFRWRVQALDSAGQTIGGSAWAEFDISR
jgi:hypothetical protein